MPLVPFNMNEFKKILLLSLAHILCFGLGFILIDFELEIWRTATKWCGAVALTCPVATVAIWMIFDSWKRFLSLIPWCISVISLFTFLNTFYGH